MTVLEGDLVHRMIERVARRQPDAVALLDGTTSLTYAELDRRANRLANFLILRYRVRPGDVVGVAVPRSPDLVVALLAVLKAGAAYLPLDPDYPPARLALMVADARPAVIVAPGSDLGFVADAALVDLAGQYQKISQMRTAAPDAACWPDSLLCVIYTSGSTGRPKGVILTHRGIANSIGWECTHYRLAPGDRLLHLASSAFSLAIVEIFAPLAAGASVVIAPAGVTRDSATLAQLVAEHGVTLLSVVPAELRMLLDDDAGLPWTALRLVITGADALPRDLHDRYLATCPSVPLLNVYGQTECSVDGTCWLCRPEDDDGGRVPVGRPISNTSAAVLDDELRPVPPGTVGGLYLGGAGLARGYLGRPDLTAERFVPDPHAGVPGARMCRTGDLARCRPGGELELYGREDHQVQVNGVRIELDELATVLREHPAVADAVVVQL